MNSHPISRRTLLAAGAAMGLLPLTAGASTSYGPLAELERRSGGRLGVAVLDTGSGAMVGHRQAERFGMCSTFKLPLAALILREVDLGRLDLARQIFYGPADMVSHAPVTSRHLARGHMSVAELAEAIQVTSDNPAANLLLKLIDGPAGMTARLRALGDPTTRVDRFEPAMNIVPAGELRDTTTPAAMAALVKRITLDEDLLKPASRERLLGWMAKTETGLKRLRAGFPPGWRAGDKTGSYRSEGMASKCNDLAICWPPGRAPLIVTAFYETPASRSDSLDDANQAVLAEAGRIAVTWSATSNS